MLFRTCRVAAFGMSRCWEKTAGRKWYRRQFRQIHRLRCAFSEKHPGCPRQVSQCKQYEYLAADLLLNHRDFAERLNFGLYDGLGACSWGHSRMAREG